MTLAFSTKAAKSLMDSGATIRRRSPRISFSNFLHRHSSSSGMVYKRLRCLNFFAYSVTDLFPWVSCRNSTSLAYLTLSGKYSERNFLLNTSQVTASYLSSIMDFIQTHQCSASPVSIYTTKATLLSSWHILASNILSRSFNHWSAASRLVLPPNFTGWCFRKSSRIHSLTVGRGSGPKAGQLPCFPPVDEGPPYAACEHPQQPPWQPPSAASPVAAVLTLPPVVASMLHVVASKEIVNPNFPYLERAYTGPRHQLRSATVRGVSETGRTAEQKKNKVIVGP